jgi:hypothetical protein
MALVQVVAINAMVPASALTVVIPEPVYLTALWQNAGILARVQYSQTGVVTADILKTLLGVKEVIFSAASIERWPGSRSRRLRRRHRIHEHVSVGRHGVGGSRQRRPNDRTCRASRARSTGRPKRAARSARSAVSRRGRRPRSRLDRVQGSDRREARLRDAGGIIINTLSTI